MEPGRILLTACLGWSVAGHAAAQGGSAPAERVKAAFLYHFGAFAEWPSTDPPAGVITIAVAGDPDVANELRHLLPGRTIHGLPARVREVQDIEDLDDDSVLFIGRAEESHLAQWIEATHERPVLIVTDMPRGLARGSMINFVLVDRHVRFEISQPAVERAGLKLSSRLLAAALRVEKND